MPLSAGPQAGTGSGSVLEALRFEQFDKSRHKRDDFDCGVAALNDFLKTKLGQHARKDITRGYVLAAADGTIAGYFTLSAGRLQVGVIPDGHGYPVRLPLPTTLIGRLAVDKRFRGRGLGEMILVHALRLAVDACETVASAVVEVDVKDPVAQAFYARYGFKSLPDDSLHMYLPMADARTLMATTKPKK
jgi:ribosomal protein S18 acetylase RimI-like enzyme